MGWDGTFTHWNSKETNKDIFLRGYPNYINRIENEGWKISQRGSDLYILFKSTKDIWWIEKVYCRKRKNEFLTKEIDAISNSCFDFPEVWLNYLDPTDKDVIRYITERTLNKAVNFQRTRETQSFNIGDVVLCRSDYSIHWNSFSIKENEDFYVLIEKNPKTKRNSKLYVIVRQEFNEFTDKWYYHTCPYRIKQKTFNACKFRQKKDIQVKSVFGF